ncbi:phosphohydrolase [Chryseobacterium koreense CCUG 49689]|uniref:Phosphohydrolase n=3 Tax=root TaxID=1 RepID=A0A0J7J373_9FLAO|nr:phosphohydrolase [Chryseobacterium koreense]KMQ72481.1 phosphohydrolase [Chryseobacterium koreense CCUG 49689]MBB5333425.1 (p)ppGpp synthase/HD superfamily hydrolase [Chryseobacterium koreense]
MTMTKEELLNKAIKIADRAHKGQTDKFGTPYIGHVIRVMNYGKTYDEKIVGVLHDVIEDCPQITLDYLLQQGFPKEIVFAIECLTKNPPNQDYTEFVKQTEKSPLAVAVKMNDLRDNMDLTRFTKPLTERDYKRLNKYLTAYLYLKEKY